MTQEVADTRRQFTEVRKKLRNLDVLFTLEYPGLLWFTWKGENISFKDRVNRGWFQSKLEWKARVTNNVSV